MLHGGYEINQYRLYMIGRKLLFRRHLLENLDDNPADGTERPPVKKKSGLPTYILCNPPSLSFLAHCTHTST